MLIGHIAFSTDSAMATLLTGETGGGQPHANMQPSLALNYIVRTDGIFAELGEVKIFAGNFAPRGWEMANGQMLSIASNTGLFANLGTTYGGDGRTTFGLPDLRGRAAIHEGNGPGLSNRRLGERLGVEDVTLGESQLPSHFHTAPEPFGDTDFAGGGQPHINMQPSLALNYLVALQGVFPSRNAKDRDGAVDELLSVTPYIGAVAMTASHVAPPGWAFADGQLLQVNQAEALFSIVGTIYGGDGRTTFGLPDLRGRAPIQPRTGPGLSPHSLGAKRGVEQVALSEAQIATHHHTLPESSDISADVGGDQSHTNMQPTLGVNYAIALSGIFPSRNLKADGSKMPDGVLSGEPFLGEIGLFAGNFAPRGWAFADGQLLTIADNQALFSLLGTTYGGDGRMTFALPDLRGRVALHAGQGLGLTERRLGWRGGVEDVTLSLDQMPAHNHRLLVVFGDTNGDGAVDADDLNDVRNNFGAMGPDDGTLPGDTFPFDGKVDINDLNAVRNHFGCDVNTPVPEPSTFVSAVLLFVLAVITIRSQPSWR